MAIFSLVKIVNKQTHAQFYEFKSKNEINLLDFSSLLHGQNFQQPTFKRGEKPVKFVISSNNYDNVNAVFITKPEMGVLFLNNVKRIYLSKPVFHQILLIYEEYKKYQVSYEEEEIAENCRTVSIVDANIKKFKNAAVFVSYNEILNTCDLSFMPVSTGANLGWINYKFTLKNGKTILYVTSHSSKPKFYKCSNPVEADFVIVNKVQKNVFYRKFELNEFTAVEQPHFSVVKNRKLDIDEFVKKHEIEDLEMVEKYDFYAMQPEEEKKEEKETNIEVQENGEFTDQINLFSEMIKMVIKNYEATLIIEFNLLENFIDVAVHILSLIERTSVQLFVVSDLFSDLYVQINNQTEWLNFEPEGEPFPIKNYNHFENLVNLNHNFNKKHKIILVNQHAKIPQISKSQKVAFINCTKEKVIENENAFNFYVKFEATISDIKTTFQGTNLYVNSEVVKVDETNNFIPLLINEHTHLYKNRLFLTGNLEITDFFSKNSIMYVFEQNQNLITEMCKKEPFYIVRDILIFPKSGIRFEIMNNGQIKRNEIEKNIDV
ncbi:hypothetical protein NUSPORA_01810 [Nucleospora cyclopteri]